MKLLVCIMLPLFLTLHVGAETTDTIKIAPIEVEAQSVAGPVSSTVISRDALQLRSPVQISEIFTLVPGLFVRDYGGLGGLKTVSIRGGTSAQTLILLNGVRLNSAQNGTVDLSVIPASFISNIEVVRGAGSSVVGANAMNGAIDLQVALPDTSTYAATVSGGSFDEWRTQASASWNESGNGVGAAVEAYGSDGSFPYQIEADGKPTSVLRTNADVRSFSGMLAGELSRYTKLLFISHFSERGVPGSVIQGVSTFSEARLKDIDELMQIRSSADLNDHVLATYGASARYLEQHYTDHSSTITGPGGIDALYITRDINAFVSVHQDVSDIVRQSLDVNTGYIDLRGELLTGAANGMPKRSSFVPNYNVVYHNEESNIVVEGSLAMNFYSDVQGEVSGFLGSRYGLSPNADIYANIGRGFRPPSFNELYYLNYGNSNLKPETSLSTTIGANTSITLFDAITSDLTVDAYASSISNLIVSIPISPVTISAQNVGRAESYGIEISERATMFLKSLQIDWNYSLQNTIDKTGRTGLDGTLIPYTPQEMFNVSGMYCSGSLYTQITWSYTSFRFAQSGEDYTSMLPSYHLVGLTLGTRQMGRAVHADVSLHIDNLFNTSYSVIRGYPMPGRTVRIDVSCKM